LFYADSLREQGRESLGRYLLQQERRQPPPPPVFTPGLSVKEFGVKADPSGNRTVAGVLRNGSRVGYLYAEVRVDLLNGAGKKVGATLAAVRDLRPGRSAAFTAPASIPGVERASVAELRGYR
jgi:hypothetical protein